MRIWSWISTPLRFSIGLAGIGVLEVVEKSGHVRSIKGKWFMAHISLLS